MEAPTQVPYPTQPQSPKRHPLRTLVIVLLVVALVVGVFVFVRSRLQENGGAPTGQEQSDPTARNAVDPFAHDRDRDGIPDEEEEALGLSTLDFDTDGDGLSDKQEIDLYKTDPTNDDTDGDGNRDGYEVLRGTNPLGEGDIPPALLEEDGDNDLTL